MINLKKLSFFIFSLCVSANIYAGAYNKNPSFYRFMRTMEIYREALDDETVLVLSTEGEFLKYLGTKND